MAVPAWLPQHGTTGWVAYTREFYCLIILEARSPRSMGWFRPRPLPLVCRWPLLPVSLRGCPSVCFCVLVCSCKDTGHVGLKPTLTTPFQLNHLFKDLIPRYGRILKRWGLGLQCTYLGGTYNSGHSKYTHAAYTQLFNFHQCSFVFFFSTARLSSLFFTS